MNVSIPRLRMFAGPNGSGKTTVKNGLNRPEPWFGIYINPDELELSIQQTGSIVLGQFGLETNSEEIRHYFASSKLLQSHGLDAAVGNITCSIDRIDFSRLKTNSYHASVLADFLRRKAIASEKSFTFETVMSSPDKIELLREAKAIRYRTYLYYVATEDPAINVERVRNRVAEGGHDVPDEKIVSRYHRSLSLLRDAIRHTDRAFLFDTSEAEPWYFAEVTDGSTIDLRDFEMPNWFRPVWDQF